MEGVRAREGRVVVVCFADIFGGGREGVRKVVDRGGEECCGEIFVGGLVEGGYSMIGTPEDRMASWRSFWLENAIADA